MDHNRDFYQLISDLKNIQYLTDARLLHPPCHLHHQLQIDPNWSSFSFIWKMWTKLFSTSKMTSYENNATWLAVDQEHRMRSRRVTSDQNQFYDLVVFVASSVYWFSLTTPIFSDPICNLSLYQKVRILKLHRINVNFLSIICTERFTKNVSRGKPWKIPSL